MARKPTVSNIASTVAAATFVHAPIGKALTQGGVSVTPTQITILREMATNADFRSKFLSDPVNAVTEAGHKLSTAELGALTRVSASQYDNLFSGISKIADGDGTHTLAYAIVLAVVVAALIAMPNPEAQVGIGE